MNRKEVADKEVADNRKVSLLHTQNRTHSPIEHITDLSALLSTSITDNNSTPPVGNILVVSAMNSFTSRIQSIDNCDHLAQVIESGLQTETDFNQLGSSQTIQQNLGSLPYASGRFSAVFSVFGSLSVNEATDAAMELLRVTAANGTLEISSWQPDGITGELMNLVSTTPELALFSKRCEIWGTQQGIASLFRHQSATTRSEVKSVRIRFHSPQQWVSFISSFFLPVKVAYASQDHAGVARLTRYLLRHARRLDYSLADSDKITMNYLHTTITHRQGF